MFIVNLTYKVSLDRVEQFLEAHIVWLKEQYQAGAFVASGRKVPRTGGVILSQLKEKSDLIKILDTDPFTINDIATYEVVEFVPSMTSEEFVFMKE